MTEYINEKAETPEATPEEKEEIHEENIENNVLDVETKPTKEEGDKPNENEKEEVIIEEEIKTIYNTKNIKEKKKPVKNNSEKVLCPDCNKLLTRWSLDYKRHRCKKTPKTIEEKTQTVKTTKPKKEVVIESAPPPIIDSPPPPSRPTFIQPKSIVDSSLERLRKLNTINTNLISNHHSVLEQNKAVRDLSRNLFNSRIRR
jgi:hypothetical protein